MSEFKIQRATRQGVIPLISLYSESGCGKTYSALLVARGLVGDAGEIHLIDTENRRASLYSDVIPGGFSVLNLNEPYTPERYTRALHAVCDAGAKVAIIDSASHEWESIGGVLDMAAENESKSGRAGLHNWRTPKFEHAKFVQYLLRSPIPIICCIRGKHKTKQRKDSRGKTEIVKDDFASPIQADDFIFESTAHAEILQDHSIHLTKCSHPELRKCFPESGPLTVEHGALIAKWCVAGGASGATSKKPESGKAMLWRVTQKIHGGKPEGIKALEAHLLRAEFIQPGESLSSLSDDYLVKIAAAIEKELSA